ncbi:TetR family transcriptional regulator [Planctomycetota bacterium]|nr:TetR family transcriptional regulator [Planctomycetota bacterium]
MKRKAKKTVKRDSAATQERLIEAAVVVFAEHGLQGATVDQICEKAQVNKRMVYHYFGDKDALYREALMRVYDAFYAIEVDLSDMLLPVDELLQMLVTRYYDFLSKNPEFVRLISFENLNHGRVAKEMSLKGKKAQIMTALQLALDKGKESGEFRAELDVEELLVSIFALCFFYFSNQHTMSEILGSKTNSRTQLKKRVSHVVDLVLNGMRAESTR